MNNILLTDRTCLRVSGPDAVTFLDGLVSNDMAAVTPGQMGFGTLLSPQGKIIHEFFLVHTADGIVLDVAASQAESLRKRLSLYKLRAAVEIAPEPSWRVLADVNPGEGEAGKKCAAGAGADDSAVNLHFVDPRLAALGSRHYQVVDQPDDASDNEAATNGDALYAQHLVRNGVPSLGHGFDADDVFLLDVNYDALGAVSYKKGCFVGQEVTSRMKRKGDIRRRTLCLTLDQEQSSQTAQKAPEIGTSITAGQAPIGAVRAWAGNAGLGMIRLDRLKAAEAPLLGGGTALRAAMPAYLT